MSQISFETNNVESQAAELAITDIAKMDDAITELSGAQLAMIGGGTIVVSWD